MLTFCSSFRSCLGTAIRRGMRTAHESFTANHGIGEFHEKELTSFCLKFLTGSHGLCRISALDFSSERTEASNSACSTGRSDGEESLLENFEKKSPRRHYTSPKQSSAYRPIAVGAANAHNLHRHGCNREYSNFESLDSSGQTIEGAERAATEMAWKDMLLSSPGAISADIETQRLFIADTNHHRVIIADGDGKIVDCIGSSPGMEDGTFETAQLCYPASAVFEADRNFLYIADSESIDTGVGFEQYASESPRLCLEKLFFKLPPKMIHIAKNQSSFHTEQLKNAWKHLATGSTSNMSTSYRLLMRSLLGHTQNHVVRRADLSTRTMSTIKRPKLHSESSIWGRFSRWMGVSQPAESEEESEKAENCSILRNPWHLKFTQEGLILVASRCFENFWALDATSGEVTEFRFQDSEVVSEEFCRQATDVKEMEDVYSLVLHEMRGNKSTVGNPWQISSVTDLVSRVVRLDNKLFFVDTEGQMIRNYNLDTGSHDTLHLSNLGLLGLPYWWSLPSPSIQSPNLLNESDNLAQSIVGEAEKLENPIHIQPGRCLLCIYPVLPGGMVVAAPIEDGSIWRQVKGSVVELSMLGGSLISHKISSAQQWIDDLDELDDPNPDTQETEELTLPLKSESGIPFYTLLDASLGAGEVIVDAVLYLRDAYPQESRADFSGTVQRKDRIYLKHLQVKVRLEIATSAPEERTKHISVLL